MTATTPGRAAKASVAAAAVAAVCLIGGAVDPASAASRPPPSVPLAAPAPTPPCATGLAPFHQRKGPVRPLPPPASTVGGARLAQPGRQLEIPPGTPPPPAVDTTAWLIADATTGAVLAACNAHVPLAPASTLKVLTALSLMPLVPDDLVYTATTRDANIDGTRVGLVAGSRYTGQQLWHALMMSSANDAASALAGAAGGLAASTARMERVARALGAQDTRVANTSGLDAPRQVSSVYDLAIFGRAALREPRLAKVIATQQYRFPGKGTDVSGSARRPAFQIQNHNRLLTRFPGGNGVKNGYTTTAGGSFVGSATRGGRTYVVALLRADTNTWRASAALLDWAFRNGTKATPVGSLGRAVPVPGPPAAPTPSGQDSSGQGAAGQGAAGQGAAGQGAAGQGAAGQDGGQPDAQGQAGPARAAAMGAPPAQGASGGLGSASPAWPLFVAAAVVGAIGGTLLRRLVPRLSGGDRRAASRARR